MAIHMSIRLAWHSDGWNGHICKRPCENSYCIGQHYLKWRVSIAVKLIQEAERYPSVLQR